MGLTITTDDKGVKVVRQDKTSSNGNSYSTYALMVSSKNSNGDWVNGFIDCRFKKDVVVENKAKIQINNAFYVVDEYNGKKYPKLMITDFALLEGGEVAQSTTDNDGFMVIPDNAEGEVPFFLD